jgi:hypothetical protein
MAYFQYFILTTFLVNNFKYYFEPTIETPIMRILKLKNLFTLIILNYLTIKEKRLTPRENMSIMSSFNYRNFVLSIMTNK